MKKKKAGHDSDGSCFSIESAETKRGIRFCSVDCCWKINLFRRLLPTVNVYNWFIGLTAVSAIGLLK